MRNRTLTQRAQSLRRDASDAERHLWQRLRARQLFGHRFRRQCPIRGYIADFACLESHLIVELDGGQHLEQRRYDERRDAVLREAGFEVIRFWNDDVLLRTNDVLEQILRVLAAQGSEASGAARRPPSQPPPASQGEEQQRAADGNTLVSGAARRPPSQPPPASQGEEQQRAADEDTLVSLPCEAGEGRGGGASGDTP